MGLLQLESKLNVHLHVPTINSNQLQKVNARKTPLIIGVGDSILGMVGVCVRENMDF